MESKVIVSDGQVIFSSVEFFQGVSLSLWCGQRGERWS